MKEQLFVKIRRGGERFWVKVNEIHGWRGTGTVDNDTDVPGYKYGDEVQFTLSEVIDRIAKELVGE